MSGGQGKDRRKQRSPSSSSSSASQSPDRGRAEGKEQNGTKSRRDSAAAKALKSKASTGGKNGANDKAENSKKAEAVAKPSEEEVDVAEKADSASEDEEEDDEDDEEEEEEDDEEGSDSEEEDEESSKSGKGEAPDPGKGGTSESQKAAAAPMATPKAASSAAKQATAASAAGAAQASTPAKGVRQDVPLIVSGCVNTTISDIIKGTYYPHSSNHGKVVYKKQAGKEGKEGSSLEVQIYYWDERDGAELCGWWFGPAVGGEMVWAYHPSRKATTPPAAEWNVPHDGPIDPQFSVTAAKPGDAKKGSKATAALAAAKEVPAAQQAEVGASPSKAASAAAAAAAAAAKEEKAAARKEEPEKKKSKKEQSQKEEKRGKVDDSIKQAEEKAKQEEERKKQEAVSKEEKSKEQKSKDRSRKKGQKAEVEDKEEKEKGKQVEEACSKEDEEKGKRAGKKGKKEEAKGKKEEGKSNKEAKGNVEEKSKKEEKEASTREEERSLEQVPELPHAEGTAASTQNFFVNAYKKRMEERAKEEEATKKKKVKEGKESKSKDAKEVKEVKDKAGKDAKDTAEGAESKKAKGGKESKDAKDGKAGQERKDSKPPGKQAKTSKGAAKDASKEAPKETVQEAPKETKKEAKEGKQAKEVKAAKDAKEQGKDAKQHDDKKEEKRKNDKEKKLREEKAKLKKDIEEQKEEEDDDDDAQSGPEEREAEQEKKKRKVDHKVEKVADRKRERDSKLRDDAKTRKRKDKSCDEDDDSPLRRPDRRKRRRDRRRCSSDDEPATYKSRRRRRSEDRKRRNDSEDDDPPRRRDEKDRRRARDDRREEDRRRRDDSGGSRRRRDGSGGSRQRQEDRARKREEGRREEAREGQRDREKDAEKGRQHEKEEKQQPLADRKEREEEEKAASDAGVAKGKAKPEEEAAGGKDLEAKALRQQQATLAVLSCFQRLSDVSLETFEDVKVEFDRVMKHELPDTGAQQDILKAEATRVFGYAQQYVEEMKEKLRLEEATRQKREGKVAATGEDKQEANKGAQEVEVIQDTAPPMPEETEEERAARREEERKRKEDERRRHEAELQRKREERRRKEREAHEKEEEKKKAERDARKKEEEEKKRQEEEKKSEERRLKEEVDQKKNKEESKVRREQQATLAVLRGLQKLSDASPDNFEALRTEFEKVMTVELPDTGAQQDMLKAEADRVFGYAQRYVEQVKAQKKQSVQEEAQKQEKAKELLAEFQKLLVAVESETGKVQSAAAPLTSDQKLPDEEVLRLSKAVKQAAEKATGACAACTQFLELKRQNILEAESTREESVKVLSLGQARNQTALQQLSEVIKAANNSRDRIAKSIAPTLWANKASDLFHKYDTDGDGFLSRAEVQAFAKLEYNFALPAENLDRIFRQLAEPGSVGLPSAKFQHLKTAVGIARHEDRCRLRRLSPEERRRREQADAAICEAVAAERRAALKETCTSIQREVDALEPVVAAAESLGGEFHTAATQVKAKVLLAQAVEVETKLTPGHKQLTKVQRLVRGVRKDMQDLKETMAEDHARLCGKVDDLGIRLKKVSDSVASRKQQILTKGFEKYESLRLDVAGKLRACIEALGGKAVDLFQVVNRGGGEKVSTDDVRHFLRENQCDLEPEKLDKVFFACASGYIMDDEDDVVPPNSVLRIGREDFMRIIRVYCKVVKEIILSDNLLIDQSEQIRRMEVGEVMEVYQGPVNEPAVNVLRIHGRVLSDGQVGWVTISGKDGLTFLVPGGNVFRVTRPCAISEDLHGIKTTRMSIVGEVLEVLDWSRTSRSAVGITRVRARARADGVIGWVTLLDSGTNTRYLEVV